MGDGVGLNVELAGAVVGVALDVRNVITAENDTNLEGWSTANRTCFCVAKSAPRDVAKGANFGDFISAPRGRFWA